MRRFYAFCDTYSIPSPFPVSECTLCYFTTFLANDMLSAQTIKTYLSAVRNTQISLGFPDPRAQAAMPRLERIQAGIRRVLATRSKKKRSRLPITPTVLEGLNNYWAESTDDDRCHRVYGPAQFSVRRTLLPREYGPSKILYIQGIQSGGGGGLNDFDHPVYSVYN